MGPTERNEEQLIEQALADEAKGSGNYNLPDKEGEALEPGELSTIEKLRAMGRIIIEKPESGQLKWD
jgi:hypothetical protein